MVFPKETQKDIPNIATDTLATLPALASSADAAFVRVDNDLVINILGDSLTFSDYFLKPVAFKTVEGSVISVADIFTWVNSQTPPVHVAANGLVTPQAQLEKIGSVSALVEGPITAQNSASGKSRTLAEGDAIYLHDTLSTAANSHVKITLNDGTVLQFGPLSRAKLDKYSYDSQAQHGELETSVFVGLFRYISGKLSGNDGQQHTTIKTPSANIGIRGSEIEAFIEDNGSTTILHKTGLIDIQSLYGAEKISVFQPNTKIYVPVGATFTDVEQLTPEQARQFQELFLPLDSQTEDSQAQSPAERSSEGQQESADDSDLDILSPDVGGRNPFSPLLPDEERFKQEFESVRSEQQPVDTQAQLGAELALGAENLQTPETAFTTLPPATVIDQAPIAEDDGPFDISGQNSITLAATTLLANDQDPEGEPLNLTGQFSQVVNGTVRLTAEGDVVFTRTSDFGDQGSFRYEVSDTQGNVASAQVNLIAEPVSAVINITFNEDNAQTLSVPAPITVLNQPDNGQVYYHQDGYLVYTPQAGFQGQDQVSYTRAGQEFVATVTVNPLTIDLPIAGELLQFSQPQHGQITDSGQGRLIYTPEPHFHGEDGFTLTMRPQSESSEAVQHFRVILEVVAVNDAPQTQADNATIAEDTALVISSDTLLANDSDVEGEPLQIIQLSPSFDPQTEANLTQGRLELSNGQIHYQPAADFYGQAEFNYTVVDAGGAQSQGQVNVTVTAVNDAPIAVDDFRVWEGEPLTLTPAALLANDRDVDAGDTLTISQVTNARNGNVSFNGNTISFTLNAGANQGGFDYEISDGAEQDRAQVTVVRRPETGVNQAPVAVDDSFNVTQNNAPIRLSAAQLLSNDSDADNDILTLTAVQPQLNAQVTLANNGDVIFTPNASFAEQGFGRFGYEIQDSAGLSSNATVTITFANQAPIARNDSIALTAIEPITLSASQLLSNDSDPNNDPLTLVSVTAGPHVQVSLENNQTILLTPEATLTDTGSFSYVIRDPQGNTASATVQLSAPASEPNAPPIAQDDTLVLNQADAASVITVAQLLSNDSDPEQDALTLTQLSAPIAGAVELTPEGEIIFTPQAEFATSGLGGFSYEITDNHGNTAQAQVTLRFTEDNLPPIAEADLIIVTDPTAPLNIAPATLLANDHDPNGDSVQITQVMNSQQGFITLAQQLEFTPTPEFASTGRASFSYELSDTQGATTTAEVTLQLFAAQADGPVHMGSQQHITLTAEELLSNDYFPQAQPPTLTLVADSAVNGNATLTAAGDIVFIRNSDFATQGLGSFRYQLSDQQGHVTTAEVTLIGDVAPTANAYATSTSKNTPLNLSLDTLLAQIKDPNLPNDSHQVTAVSSTETGTVELDPVNHQLLYTPADNFTGTVNLTYTVTDSQGLSVEAPLTITVDNRAPEAEDDNLSTVLDQPLTISVAEDLLANDQDADPGDHAALAFQVQTDTVTHGQLEVDDQVLVFTPEAGFEGEAQFEYTITDSSGDQDTAQVTIQVETDGVYEDSFTTGKNQSITIAIAELQANDDLKNTAITIEDGSVRHGQVSQQGDSLVFTPEAQFDSQNAEDAAGFTYIATDDSGQVGRAQVTINVNNSPPQAIDDPGAEDLPLTTSIETPVSILTATLLTNDSDPDPNDPLTLTAVEARSTHQGEVVLNGDAVVYTPAAGFSGSDRFEYTLTDSSGASATATVTVEVTPPNQPPVIELETTPVIYTGEQSVLIAETAMITDIDSPDFEGGKLNVMLTANRSPQDQLAIKNQGAITVSSNTGGNILFNGTQVGNFFTNFSTGALVISLNAQADEASTTELLQAVTYENTSPFLTTQPRTVEFSMTDGDGGSSTLVSREIQIQPPIPVPVAEDDAVARPFNTPTTIAVADLLANDRYDNPTDIIEVTGEFTNVTPGVEVNLVNNDIQVFIDSLVARNFNQVQFDYTVADSAGEQDSATVTVTPTNVQYGTAHADTLTGSPEVDIILGQGGNDTFMPTLGADILLGGEGDDTFLINPDTAGGVHIEGSSGVDTLSLNGAEGKLLNLIQNNSLPEVQKFNLSGIDKIDLHSDSGKTNQLFLSIQDVLDITDHNQLTVEGNSASMVTSTQQGWIEQGFDSSGLYKLYTATHTSGQEVELLVSTQITFQLIN